MIFVSTGSRKFQFDRMIIKIDELVEQGIIKEELFAQIAETTYIPKHIDYKRYLVPEEFSDLQKSADLVITHAGTGALIGALKKEKQVYCCRYSVCRQNMASAHSARKRTTLLIN